jgi:hypothetical protein
LIARKLFMAVQLRMLSKRKNRRKSFMKSRKRSFCIRLSPNYSIRFKEGLEVIHLKWLLFPLLRVQYSSYRKLRAASC